MANLNTLAKDTAIYGLSSIVGRFLNYLLVPLYTASLSAASGGYGVITNIYAYVALLMVLLTFGMETTFFRFVNRDDVDPRRAYSTILLLVGGVGLAFVTGVLLFLPRLAGALGYADHPEYVACMFTCVAIDAFQCIPFAYLRHRHRPWKFLLLKMGFIVVNILLNLLYFVALPAFYAHSGGQGLAAALYDPSVGVGYAFYINLFCTATVTLFFYPELTGFRYVWDGALARRMLRYGWPILILGIAGILNQTADKILYPMVQPGPEGKVQLGIYGACAKVAMIMAMITQAFRYAYEPFVFGASRDKDQRTTYATAMKYFLIFTLLAFLLVVAYLDILQYIIAPDYRAGLAVVPIVMVAEIMMGIYFNLSFWYKLIDRTVWGAWFSGAGCLVLILINVWGIPRYGYMACAWAGVAGYGTSMVLSYVVGQRKYPIAYPLGQMARYTLLAAVCYALMRVQPQAWPLVLRLGLNTVVVMLFTVYIVRHDFPLSKLPVVGKYFR